jgi:hypothetical protein
MVEQIQRLGEPGVLSGAAGSFLTAVTRQGVEHPGGNLGVSVIQGGNQGNERLFVGELIENRDALSAHDRLVVAKGRAGRSSLRRPLCRGRRPQSPSAPRCLT